MAIATKQKPELGDVLQEMGLHKQMNRRIAAKAEVNQSEAAAFTALASGCALVLPYIKKENEGKEFLGTSDIFALSKSLRNFKGSDSEFMYDKANGIYIMTVDFKGKKRILEMKVGDEELNIRLMNLDGKTLEKIRQYDGRIEFGKA